MTSTAQTTEIRRTDWIQCKDGPWYPSAPHGGIAAYRIWTQFDGRTWWQRHEWKNADGSTRMNEWIHGHGHCVDSGPISATA